MQTAVIKVKYVRNLLTAGYGYVLTVQKIKL